LSCSPYYYHFVPKEYGLSKPILASTEFWGIKDSLNNKFFLLNKYGEKVTESIYDKVRFSINDKGYTALLKGDYWGCIDREGNEILGFKYKKIQILPNGLIEYTSVNDEVKYLYSGIELPQSIGDYFVTKDREKTKIARRYEAKF
jgi:hypothetical protein